MRWRRAVSPRRLLVDGPLLGLTFTLFVIASLRLDRRLWLDDYPPDIRAAVGNAVTAPLAVRVIVAGVFLTLMLGGLLCSNRLMARDLGRPVGFGRSFAHTFALILIVSVIDLLVVDWLVFTAWEPAFVVFPGTESLPGYKDNGFHVQVSFLNWRFWLGSAVAAGLVGAQAV